MARFILQSMESSKVGHRAHVLWWNDEIMSHLYILCFSAQVWHIFKITFFYTEGRKSWKVGRWFSFFKLWKLGSKNRSLIVLSIPLNIVATVNVSLAQSTACYTVNSTAQLNHSITHDNLQLCSSAAYFSSFQSFSWEAFAPLFAVVRS